MSFWLAPLSWMLLMALLAGLLGWVGSPAAGLALFGLGMLVMVGVQLHYLNRLRRWLRDPDLMAVPDGYGAWAEIFSTIYRDRRRHVQGAAELAQTLARSERVAQALPDGIVLIDSEQRIEWCNALAERLLSIDLARDRGRIFSQLVRYPGVAAALSGSSPEQPLVVRTLDNPQLSLWILVIRFDAHDRIVLVRDVTLFERTETIRRDFIANVSHELRTPLTIINGYLEHLTEGAMTEALAARAMKTMQDQAFRMTRLVEDLLVLSRLEAESTPTGEEVVDVGALIAQVVEEGRSLSAGRHDIQIGEVSPLRLRAGPDELRSALSNLITNAIRYTPEGGSIRVQWTAGPTEGRLSVSDTGIGIAPEHLPRLTERFYRVERSRSRETGGTGLGLAIVKHVLIRHQASLDIQSTPAKGSQFSGVFPAARVVEPAAVPQASAATPAERVSDGQASS
jgi:two-component system, OmpR family, phosphate regulon sensor histidine kinase PhoR